ncbi:hypothetical protein DY000_02000950 [Brassica cretica]|uniref:Uncharacterized protein n=1 Tax=Brassica cretica TaxID=69181 RepID=A0ABQ7CA07_BRACR|nr:hypothetical protein DY000_02000950 [Brassica cretica]
MERGCYQRDRHGDRDVGDFHLEEDQSPQHHPLHRHDRGSSSFAHPSGIAVTSRFLRKAPYPTVLKRGRSGRLRAGAALGVGAPPRFSSVRPKTRPKKHTSYYAISKFENDNFFTNPL